ncbi:MAG: GAF domain-containing protein, partial [Paracoccaceae bacterium]
MEIVEAERDPVAHRRAKVRRLRRLATPTLVVLAVAAGAVGGSYLAHSASQRGARDIARSYVSAVDIRIREKVGAYFEPAEKVTEVVSAALRSAELRRAERRQLDRISRSYLSANPQMVNIYVGADDGSFMMTSRAQDGWLQKLVSHEDGKRRTSFSDLGPGGEVLETRGDPDDRFDPRTRPWFKNAAAEAVWTPIYRFFTADSLGLTVSRRFGDEGGAGAVVGVDIMMKDLEGFLDSLTIGGRGAAFIVDGDGYFVVAPPEGRAADIARGRVHVDDLDAPVLKGIYDHFLIEREFSGLFRVGGEWYMASFSSLNPVLGRDWWLIFSIPEDALIGFVETSGLYSLGASLMVAGLAIAMLAFVVFQSMSAERRAARLDLDSARFREAEDAYAELARVSAGVAPARAVRAIAELVARMTGARAAGIWRLNDAGARIACLDRFDAEEGGHSEGAHVDAQTCPRLFERLTRGQAFILTPDEAPADGGAFAEIERAYPGAARNRTLLSAPILADGRVRGAVWIEDPTAVAAPVADPVAFADAAAGQIASAVARFLDEGSGMGEAPPPMGAGTGGALPRLEARRLSVAERALAGRGVTRGEAAELSFDGLAAAAVEFHDPVLFGARNGPDASSILHRASVRVLNEAQGAAPGYARIAGRRITLADDATLQTLDLPEL